MIKRIIPVLIIFLLCSSVPSAFAKVTKEGRLWQDESIYSIMIDRFNNGDTQNDLNVNAKDLLSYNGGDFQGIIDRLDYIHDMGFTAIRLTPIFDNAKNGYHGYWVTDFYKVDEHFGSMKTFQKLVKEAHKRKMKVIVDFVANNVAQNHPWINEADKQNWFHPKQEIKDWNDQQQVENGWVDGLPDLNQEDPEVSKYLIDAAKWWIEKTNIDGYSLPEINHVPMSFWRDFSTAVKDEKKNFFLLGIPSNSTSVEVKKYQAAGVDSVFDFKRSQDLRKVFETTDHILPSDTIDFGKKQKSEWLANFLDNENTVRFTHDMVDKRQFPGSRWKTALTYLYTTPGIPIIYYGTEIALNGTETPDNRRLMNFRTEKDLIDYITNIGRLRSELPSLTRGTFEMLYNKDGMMVYKRMFKGETAVVAINNSSESQKVTLTADQLESGKELRGLLAGDIVRDHKGQYILIMDRDNSEIYALTDKSGINFTLIGSLIAVYILVFIFLYFIIKRRKRNKIE
ncbi:alpha-amylase family glycosyl hydrolase [Neobacillus mesonae]|uniref:alpha-amylase family glycosyl hydrolase n=1 Tax=Neobacillus mesonae TaxID=1193713 RepID=UPI0020401E1A|nr:alpha-amylase family glycosyl hydrolase [Neobacillus mesonae]MCM3570032.1 alpha-amylase family glycosyl hydrolase [Neobacillus mesonae]